MSFSLDSTRSHWEKASEEEQLPWLNVSDMKAITSPVTDNFGVKSLPVNYLVEGVTGKIVAKNLRNNKLDEKLAELLSESSTDKVDASSMTLNQQ